MFKCTNAKIKLATQIPIWWFLKNPLNKGCKVPLKNISSNNAGNKAIQMMLMNKSKLLFICNILSSICAEFAELKNSRTESGMGNLSFKLSKYAETITAEINSTGNNTQIKRTFGILNFQNELMLYDLILPKRNAETTQAPNVAKAL